MKALRLSFLFAMLACALAATAQEEPTRREIEDAQKLDIINERIEFIVESMTDEDIDLTTLFDDLEYYYDHPLNLNFASREKLQNLMILNEAQINALLTHIDRNGKLITIYELQSVQGFNLETIRAILPFVKVSANFDAPNLTFKEVRTNGKNELYLRYIATVEELAGSAPISPEELEESPNSRFLGNPDRYYFRYRFKYNNNVSVGVTGEKDTGEEFFTGSNKQGFDFYSAHFYLYEIGKIKHLAVGDYQIQLGQGLTMWSGRATRKSALDVINVKRNPRTIRPYTSVDENNFLRGVAATVELNKWELTGFVSRNGRDANISVPDTLDSDAEVTVSSLQTSGFHRTPGEVEDKDALTVTQFGTHMRYTGRKGSFGITGVGIATDARLTPRIQPYNQFSTITSNIFKTGIDYNYVWRNLNFFGEVSASDNGGLATINGVLASIDRRLAVTMAHRHYDRNYQTYSSNGLSESGTNNESGMYLGLEAKPAKRWIFSAYYDRYRFPWLRFTADAPSEGVDYLLQLTYKPNRRFEAYVRYRQEIKETDARLETPSLDDLVNENRQGFRFNMGYKISEEFRLRTRVELAWHQEGIQPQEQGFLAFQDIRYKPLSSPLSFDARFALFQTDSYDSRIYAYENDILYVYSIPAFFNRGSRWYITAKYRISRWMDLWVRYGQTHFATGDSIGSGLTAIQGRTRSDLKAQIRFKF